MSKYIVIEGPIGVGKTTLAKKIAHSLHYEVLLETFSDNPFLINFYNNQKEFALATQLQFLLNRSKVFLERERLLRFKSNCFRFFDEKRQTFRGNNTYSRRTKSL